MKLRKILLLLALAACATVNGNAQDCCHRDTAMTGEVSPSTLIIYYSGNSKKVLKSAEKIGAKVFYNYTSFDAVAFRK
mgnify:CR=1 FL=1